MERRWEEKGEKPDEETEKQLVRQEQHPEGKGSQKTRGESASWREVIRCTASSAVRQVG